MKKYNKLIIGILFVISIAFNGSLYISNQIYVSEIEKYKNTQFLKNSSLKK